MYPIKLKIFYPGKQIKYKGSTHIVDHVHVKNYILSIKFRDVENRVDSDDIDCEYTVIENPNQTKPNHDKPS